MNARMAAPAQRQQVFQSIVPEVFMRSRPPTVDMVNVQVVLAPAMLAGVLVAGQGGFSIAAEKVIVAGLIGVFLQALFVRCKPVMDALYLVRALASRAACLRAGLVFKIIPAGCAHQNRSDGGGVGFTSKLGKRRLVSFRHVLRPAFLAGFLMTARRLVLSAAGDAVSRCVAISRLPVRLQRAGLAPLHVRRAFLDNGAAAGASQRSVRFHRSPQYEAECFVS